MYKHFSYLTKKPCTKPSLIHLLKLPSKKRNAPCGQWKQCIPSRNLPAES